ncbi:condensin complex non-SMC subunit Cnd1 [Batrachochytrium dendrobatidis]|nr:condensin complex non-SMC subunit Cnd1 [Batrachochytrium dendrobatidis]
MDSDMHQTIDSSFYKNEVSSNPTIHYSHMADLIRPSTRHTYVADISMSDDPKWTIQPNLMSILTEEFTQESDSGDHTAMLENIQITSPSPVVIALNPQLQSASSLQIHITFKKPVCLEWVQIMQSASRIQELYLDGLYQCTAKAELLSDSDDEESNSRNDHWYLLSIENLDKEISTCTIKFLGLNPTTEFCIASIVVGGSLSSNYTARSIYTSMIEHQPKIQSVVNPDQDSVQGTQSVQHSPDSGDMSKRTNTENSLILLERKLDEMSQRLDARMERMEKILQLLLQKSACFDMYNTK